MKIEILDTLHHYGFISKSIRAAIASNAKNAYTYSQAILEAPWPEGETRIASDPKWAYFYAMYVLKGRFPAGEATIAKDDKWAHLYAYDILKLGEDCKDMIEFRSKLKNWRKVYDL